MTEMHPIACECGKLTGQIRPSGKERICHCYCRDCQAFAHFLKRPQDILDDHGGTVVLHHDFEGVRVFELIVSPLHDRIIETARRHTQRAMDVLSGRAGSGSIYGAGGEAQTLRRSRYATSA